MWYVIKIFVREMALFFYAWLFGYYTELDKLPAYNWFKLSDGDYSYLYKRRISACPELFKDIYGNMFFQLEKVEMGYFEDVHKLAYLKSLYATTKRPQFLNQARSLEYKINERDKKEEKTVGLNDILSYIEDTFNKIGQIDVKRINTLYFFHLYNKAIEKNKKDANIKT